VTYREEWDVEVRIGVIYTAKEIEVEVTDDTNRDEWVTAVEASVGRGSGMLWLTDRRGRKVGVPADKVAYVDIGAEAGERRVGFAAL
jgi:hypothetical protein